MVQAVTPVAAVANPTPADSTLTLNQRLAEARAQHAPEKEGARAKKRKPTQAGPGALAGQPSLFNPHMPHVFAHAPLKSGHVVGNSRALARDATTTRPAGTESGVRALAQTAVQAVAQAVALNEAKSIPTPGTSPQLEAPVSHAAPVLKPHALAGAEERERPGLTPELLHSLRSAPALPEKAAAPLPPRPFAFQAQAPVLGDSASAGPGLTYRFTRWGEQHTVKVQHSLGVDGQLNYRLQPSDTLVGARLQQHLADAPGQTWLARDAHDQPGGQSRQQGEPEAEDEDA